MIDHSQYIPNNYCYRRRRFPNLRLWLNRHWPGVLTGIVALYLLRKVVIWLLT